MNRKYRNSLLVSLAFLCILSPLVVNLVSSIYIEPPPSGGPAPVISSVTHSITQGTNGPGSASVYVHFYVSFHYTSDYNKIYLKWYDGSSWVTKKTWSGCSSGWFSYTISGLNGGSYKYKIYAYSYYDGIPVLSTSTSGTLSIWCTPDDVAISNLDAYWEGLQVRIDFDVNWGTTAVPTPTYEVKIQWDETSSFSSPTTIKTWTTKSSSYSYVHSVSSSGTYWLKVTAKATNSYGTESDDSGIVHTGTIVYPLDDTYGCEPEPNTVMGSSNMIQVGSGTGARRHAFFKFDTGIGYPYIYEAVLHVYCWGYYEDDGIIQSQIVNTNSWNEESLTWNNRPTGTSGTYSSDSNGLTPQWDTFNVWGFGQQFSIRLVDIESTTPTQGRLYYSKEYSSSSYRPYLELLYWDEGGLLAANAGNPSQVDGKSLGEQNSIPVFHENIGTPELQGSNAPGEIESAFNGVSELVQFVPVPLKDLIVLTLEN